MSELISIKEAKKLLGKKHRDMSDEQVQELINNLSVIARGAIKMGQEKIAKEKADERQLIELASFLYSRYIFHKAKEFEVNRDNQKPTFE